MTIKTQVLEHVSPENLPKIQTYLVLFRIWYCSKLPIVVPTKAIKTERSPNFWLVFILIRNNEYSFILWANIRFFSPTYSNYRLLASTLTSRKRPRLDLCTPSLERLYRARADEVLSNRAGYYWSPKGTLETAVISSCFLRSENFDRICRPRLWGSHREQPAPSGGQKGCPLLAHADTSPDTIIDFRVMRK